MLSTTQQGQTGPHAGHPGFGTQLVSLAGFTHLIGWADREPANLYGAYTDAIAPRFGTVALLAALIIGAALAEVNTWTSLSMKQEYSF